MAQSIRNLALGSKVKDPKGNKFIVVAYNHYSSNEVTLLSEEPINSLRMAPLSYIRYTYAVTDVAYYLENNYLRALDDRLVENIKVTSVPCYELGTSIQINTSTIRTKAFLLSATELGFEYQGYSGEGRKIDYVANNLKNSSYLPFWTRTIMDSTLNYSQCHIINKNGYIEPVASNEAYSVIPAINVNASVLVSDDVDSGYYRIVFNAPPVIQNISNIKGNYGSATEIVYTATDSDNSNLTHYISFDNGSNWTEINPTRKGDTYYYSHVFNELNTYYCRVKVVDTESATVSNGFIVEVNASSPTVNIVSVVDRVITFKANCLTHDITKVEILINDEVVKTYEKGFDFNLVYELDRALLNLGKNSIQIKATSIGNLYGYRDLEANKTTYNLPPVGTKVVISNNVYTITEAEQVGVNQLYTLERNLETNVSKNQEIRIEQDSVKVLCSLANLESRKDFKEMKLVKSKKLKGIFEGYVEEKYELFGEGRYSSIKIENERFNNSVESEIIELQQHFDYIED